MGLLKLLDKALEIGSYMDFVTPAVSLATTDRSDRFAFDAGDINHVERRLKQAGIRMKHKMIIDGQFVFDVESGRGDEAARILGLE